MEAEKAYVKCESKVVAPLHMGYNGMTAKVESCAELVNRGIVRMSIPKSLNSITAIVPLI